MFAVSLPQPPQEQQYCHISNTKNKKGIHHIQSIDTAVCCSDCYPIKTTPTTSKQARNTTSTKPESKQQKG